MLSEDKQIKLVVLLNRLLQKDRETVSTLFTEFNLFKTINDKYFKDQREYLSAIMNEVGGKYLSRFIIDKEQIDDKQLKLNFDPFKHE